MGVFVMDENISKLLAKVSNALDYDVYEDINLNWESLAEMYNIENEVGYYNGSYFNIYSIDIIVKNIFYRSRLLFKEVFYYISNRYDVPILEEYLNDYDYLFDDTIGEISFENEIDADNIKIFISFNSNDSDEAVKIQDFFLNCGVDCFLSKTSIDISEEYKTRAFEEICNANVFIYLLSENSKVSDWCDQEMGMAYMKHELGKSEIFVVSHDGINPYGFLSSFNAGFTYDGGYLLDIARKIDEKLGSALVSKIRDYNDGLIDSKIKDLFAVGDYESACSLLNFINVRSEFLDKDQLERICNAALRNDQIFDCYKCEKPLINILSDCKDLIDDDLYQQVFNKITPLK